MQRAVQHQALRVLVNGARARAAHTA